MIVRVLPADVVGDRGPEEAAAHVEDAEEADEPARGRGGHPARKHLLAHRRGLPEDADARRHVHAENDPDQPELRGLERLVDVDVLHGDELLRPGRRDAALGLQPGGGTRTMAAPTSMKHA